MINSTTNVKGEVDCTIEYKNGEVEKHHFKNTILRGGKTVLAKALINDVGDPFDYFVDKMLFGTSGTVGGTPRFVDSSRSGLFGTVLLSKNVISDIDETGNNATAIFTAVITFDEGIGSVLNEMALQLDNSDLFSMVTFPDLSKTADMQIVWDWKITIL